MSHCLRGTESGLPFRGPRRGKHSSKSELDQLPKKSRDPWSRLNKPNQSGSAELGFLLRFYFLARTTLSFLRGCLTQVVQLFLLTVVEYVIHFTALFFFEFLDLFLECCDFVEVFFLDRVNCFTLLFGDPNLAVSTGSVLENQLKHCYYSTTRNRGNSQNAVICREMTPRRCQ